MTNVITLSNFIRTVSFVVFSKTNIKRIKTNRYPKNIKKTSTLLTRLFKVHTVSQLSASKGAVMCKKKTNQMITMYIIIEIDVVVE